MWTLLVLCLLDLGYSFRVSQISMLTSTKRGAGMDKPGFWGGGGRYSILLCPQGPRNEGEPNCCHTGHLNTEDDNWELGQVDRFVGSSQIRGCGGFRVGLQGLEMTLLHTGSNGGLLDWVKIHPWHTATHYMCRVGVKLDHTTNHRTECQLVQENNRTQDWRNWCNGNSKFCQLKVDQFLWAGTHNSGTGQKAGVAKCASKNQDLTAVEQLELGIRMLDVDVIKSSSLLGCNGLETGHGATPGWGLYQCYGKIDWMLQRVVRWLERHPTELLVLHFGNIGFPEETIPALREALLAAFTNETVLINTKYKETGRWPTLGEAVRDNKRVFVFIRDKNDIVRNEDLELVKEVKIKPGEDIPEKNNSTLDVTVTSSYKAKSIGTDCSYLLETSREACRAENQTRTDFTKLSLFSRFGKGGVVGSECLHQMAKKCNNWIEGVIRDCSQFRQFTPSFVLVDYPNYQGISQKNIVEVTEIENIRRVGLFRSNEV